LFTAVGKKNNLREGETAVKGIKKIVAIGLVLCLVLGAVPVAYAAGIETTAKSAILIDGQSGQVLYEKAAHQPLPMASITKIMTLLLAVEAVEQGKVNLDDDVVASEEAYNLGGSEIWLEPGETMKLETLMLAIAVHSANDACIAIAEHIAGSTDAFVEMMNARAKELGLKDTKFANPHGLSEKDHYMSAYDIAMLSKEAMQHELFRKMIATQELKLKRRNSENHFYSRNKLLFTYKGADGVKTGFTDDAGYCLAASATRNNLRLIAVVMNAGGSGAHFRECTKLLNYGFANYTAKEIIKKGDTVKVAKVCKGKDETVALVAKDSLYVMVKKGEDEKFRQKLRLTKEIVAPFNQGAKFGELIVYRGDKPVGKIDVVAAEGVEKGTLFTLYHRMFKDWFQLEPQN